MTAIPQKLSFSEARAKTQAEKNNSDLANLAHAMEYVAAAKIEAQKAYFKFISDAEELETKIVAAAEATEAGVVLDYDTVSDLYNKSRRISIAL